MIGVHYLATEVILFWELGGNQVFWGVVLVGADFLGADDDADIKQPNFYLIFPDKTTTVENGFFVHF